MMKTTPLTLPYIYIFMHARVCLTVCLHGHIMYASNNGMTGLKENLSEEEYICDPITEDEQSGKKNHETHGTPDTPGSFCPLDTSDILPML